MADPLSITLAAVTLVTALKDIVELGDKIKDCFAKVPDNLRKSQKLALEICETLHELEEFCAENNDILERKPRMKKALVNLQRKLKEVHGHCAHLIPPSSEKYVGRLKVAIYLWRHGRRIQAEISELWKEVDNCYTKFTMFASLQTEVQSHTILNTILKLRVSDVHIQSFHNPRITISKALSDMDEHMAADMHLKVQIHKVTKILNKFSIDFIISNLNNPKIITTSYPSQSTHSFYTPAACKTISLYQVAVQHTFLLQDLQSSSISRILKQGIKYLDHLGSRLTPLGMREEATHIHLWNVKLHRILVSQDPQNYTRPLILRLYKLSISYRWSDNIQAAYNSIEECVALSQQLQTPSASVATRLMHARVLTELYCVFNIMGKSEQSSIIIQEAIRTYEDAFHIDNGWLNHGMDNNTNLSPTWSNHNAHSDLFLYTRALRYLAQCLRQQGSIPDALNAQMKALSILCNIFILHPNSSADLNIAVVLHSLTRRNFKHLMSMDQSLSYIEQCLVIWRKYAELNPLEFGKYFCIDLCQKAEILWKMSKVEGALASITEAAKLAPRLVNDKGFITVIKEKETWYLEKISHRQSQRK